jgi:phage recombination protein Bet
MTKPNTEEKAIVEFVPFGADSKVKLSIEIVKRLICVKTKSGKVCSDDDAIKFMALCHARKLNPFEGDCYLIGYDGHYGPTFSLITAHQAFLKRAELNPEYDGMQSGVVVERGGKIVDIEGDFIVTGDKLLGGWATVYFKNRKHPMFKRVRLQRFQKGFGVWQDDPAGMICKCAEADALRSSFPTMLGGLYIAAERRDDATAAAIASPVIEISDSTPATASEEQHTGTQTVAEPASKPTAAGPPGSQGAVRKKSTKLKPKHPTMVEVPLKTERGPFDTAPDSRPNQKLILGLLEKSEFTRGDFMSVCEKNEWLGRGKVWNTMEDVPDDMFATFLADDEWEVVLGELKKFRQ